MTALFVSLGAWRKKGLPFLLEVVHRLDVAGIDIRLDIAGRPSLGEEDLPGAASDLVARKRVRFLGYCTDMSAVYESAVVLLCASHYETCSLAMLEALAHGLAILTTPVNGTEEFVADGVNGWIMPRNPAIFADALIRLASDPVLLARFQMASRERAAAFHVSNIAARTRDVYRGVRT